MITKDQTKALAIMGAAFAATMIFLLMMLQLILPQFLNFYNLVQRNQDIAVGILLAASVALLIKFIFGED